MSVSVPEDKHGTQEILLVMVRTFLIQKVIELFALSQKTHAIFV